MGNDYCREPKRPQKPDVLRGSGGLPSRLKLSISGTNIWVLLHHVSSLLQITFLEFFEVLLGCAHIKCPVPDALEESRGRLSSDSRARSERSEADAIQTGAQTPGGHSQTVRPSRTWVLIKEAHFNDKSSFVSDGRFHSVCDESANPVRGWDGSSRRFESFWTHTFPNLSWWPSARLIDEILVKQDWSFQDF